MAVVVRLGLGQWLLEHPVAVVVIQWQWQCCKARARAVVTRASSGSGCKARARAVVTRHPVAVVVRLGLGQ